MAAGMTEFLKVAGDPARVAGKIGVMGKIRCARPGSSVMIPLYVPSRPTSWSRVIGTENSTECSSAGDTGQRCASTGCGT